jgi:hypothetical protein
MDFFFTLYRGHGPRTFFSSDPMPIPTPVKLALASALLAACAGASAADVGVTISYDKLDLLNTSYLPSASVSASDAASASVDAHDLPSRSPEAPYSTYMYMAADASATGEMNTFTRLAAAGQNAASATWHDSIVNTSGAAQTYQFNLSLSNAGLYMGGWTADLASRDYRGSFSADILVNGVSVWHTERGMTEDANGFHLNSAGADIGTGTLQVSGKYGYYSLPDCQGSVSLGQLAAGQSADVSYVLTSRAYWDDPDGCAYECGHVSASLGDPLSVSGTHISVSAVPEADTYAMLLGGLGLLGLVARRRKQA